MSDLIKREDAIKTVDAFLGTDSIVERIKRLPSAGRPQGEWIEKEIFGEYNDDVHHYVSEWQSARCSVCGKYHTTPYAYYFDEYNFCPSCGAQMKGADDEGHN